MRVADGRAESKTRRYDDGRTHDFLENGYVIRFCVDGNEHRRLGLFVRKHGGSRLPGLAVRPKAASEANP